MGTIWYDIVLLKTQNAGADGYDGGIQSDAGTALIHCLQYNNWWFEEML